MRSIIWLGALIAVVALGAAEKSKLQEAALAPPRMNDYRVEKPSKNEFVVRNALVFDGRNLLRGNDVWVKDGFIRAVGKKLTVPPSAQQIDGTGDTLLPALIDAHTHTWGDALRQALVMGVATEIDMYSDVKFDATVRQRETSGKNLDWADLRSAGTLVTVPGGHGTEYGFAIPTLNSELEAQQFVDARLTEGSDFIKVIYDDRAVYQGSAPTLTTAELAAVIKAAHRRGKLAVAHVATRQGAQDAVDAGVDGLAHIFADQPMSPELLAIMKRRQTFVIATLAMLEAAADNHDNPLLKDTDLEPYISPATRATLANPLQSPLAARITTQNAFSAAKALHSAGITVLAGTDCPNPGTAHGLSIHRELELLVKAGFKPIDALAAATSVPAHTFGLTDRGRIWPGLRADLLLVRGDPTQDITTTRKIVAVWKTGARVDRDSLASRVAKEWSEDSALRKLPLPPGAASGLVSDFENGEIDSSFGAGWSISMDDIAGGKSRAEMSVVRYGAHNSRGSLEIRGTIASDLSFAWAGALFSPASEPFAPANLSSKHSIRFWARGDGRRYLVLLYTKSNGYIPLRQAFRTTGEWREFTFPIASFGGSDGHDITGILFSPFAEPGSFLLGLDDVRLE
jgi:imidazolonepropionase-like amidohydrolase